MTKQQYLDLFKITLTDKEKQFFTEPMNSRDDARFQSFVAGYKLGSGL